jgi:hypothetical protein
MVKFFGIVILFLMSSYSFAGTIHPDIPDEKYVNYGSKFHYILKISGQNADKEIFYASAVAIKPRWILTAAHVVKNTRFCFVHINNKSICLPKVIYHQEFESNTFGHNDIALAYTDQDIGLSFYPELYTNDDEAEKVCSISGYGITGNFSTGTVYSDDNRRAGSNIVDHIENKLLICTPSKNKYTSLEFLIASGDSGGGLFIGNKLAGINSCVLSNDGKPDSTYGDESGHTRVSAYADWIYKTILEEENNEIQKK